MTPQVLLLPKRTYSIDAIQHNVQNHGYGKLSLKSLQKLGKVYLELDQGVLENRQLQSERTFTGNHLLIKSNNSCTHCPPHTTYGWVVKDRNKYYKGGVRWKDALQSRKLCIPGSIMSSSGAITKQSVGEDTSPRRANNRCSCAIDFKRHSPPHVLRWVVCPWPIEPRIRVESCSVRALLTCPGR